LPKTPTVSFANLICRFGEKFVLLDLANEIVIPAFIDTTLRRKYGATNYFFLEVTIKEIAGPKSTDIPLLVVYGRLVKDTVLTSEQVYTPEHGLEPAAESIPSSPSSFFALILNNHKVMYMPEMAYAPTIGAFAVDAPEISKDQTQGIY
jgi:hypothetical protein